MCDLPFDLWVVMSLVAHFQNFDGDHALRAWAVIPKEEITAVSITFGSARAKTTIPKASKRESEVHWPSDQTTNNFSFPNEKDVCGPSEGR